MTLPLKYKKNILKFCREYENLSIGRTMIVEFPPIKTRATILWDSKMSVSLTSDFSKSLEDIFYSNPPLAIVKLNKQIVNFCKKTEKWGRKYMKNKDWLWEEVFWTYPTEAGNGEQFEKVHRITWE